MSARFLFPDFELIPGPGGPITVRAVIDQYLDHLKIRVSAGEYSHQGFRDVQRDLTRFAAWSGNLVAMNCKRHDLIAWLAANPQWKSNATKKRNLGEICACFQWAEDEELISKNHYRRPKNLRLRTRRRPDASAGQYVAFMRRGTRALRRILFFLWNSGARPGEARELTWDMLRLDESVAIRDKHKTIDLQAEPQPRIIGIDPCLLRFLRNLHRHRSPTQDYVFLNSYGNPWTNVGLDRAFRRCRRRIMRDDKFAKYGVGEKLTPYCFRHSYCTEGVEAGIGERQIADQLGHTSTRLIQHYSHAAVKVRHLRRVAAEVRQKRRKIRRADCHD